MKIFEKETKGYYDLVRTDALKILPAENRWNSVLEVGCGDGLTLEHLKKKNIAAKTTGVEIDPSAAERATGRVDRVLNCSADVMRRNLQNEEFDLILCLDVLEHLYDPWTILREIEAVLQPGGYLLISIPNVQHWSVIVSLLFGRWNYTKAGLMDQTHIRFFTEKSLRQLIFQANMNVLKCEGQMGKDIRVLDYLTFRLFHGFFSYQYFLLAQKS